MFRKTTIRSRWRRLRTFSSVGSDNVYWPLSVSIIADCFISNIVVPLLPSMKCLINCFQKPCSHVSVLSVLLSWKLFWIVGLWLPQMHDWVKPVNSNCSWFRNSPAWFPSGLVVNIWSRSNLLEIASRSMFARRNTPAHWCFMIKRAVHRPFMNTYCVTSPGKSTADKSAWLSAVSQSSGLRHAIRAQYIIFATYQQ